MTSFAQSVFTIVDGDTSSGFPRQALVKRGNETAPGAGDYAAIKIFMFPAL